MAGNLQVDENKIKSYYKTIAIKRFFDILVSLILLVVIFVPALFITLAIFLQDRHNPFFVQERIGRNGKVFKIIKFRTMVVGSEKLENELLKNSKNGFVQVHHDPRVTKFGKILRHTSFDEIPQFINVLKGDMSLIGPRPFIAIEIEQLNTDEAKRMKVYPGLTGLAQLKGRSRLSIHDVVKFDIEYINKYTLLRDFRILINTIFVVLGGV